MANKKKQKHKKPDTLNLSEDEILDFMEELRQKEEFKGLPENELRVKAIEMLFEEYE
ncbi:MAG TPA: hypothetical protein VJ939_06935 [Bacteroidales bacterium]|nr:hypothetical protein [Bacteroidales bacterium]